MQGSFSVWTESKKIRELRLTPMQRHIFLYRKAILFCKKENKENNKATYHFKRFLQVIYYFNQKKRNQIKRSVIINLF